MVNIWALHKEQAIRHALLILTERLGAEAFVLDPATCADTKAIYLCHPEEPEVRAWLHTLGQSKHRYGLHLEYPNGNFDVHEALPLAEVVRTLAAHFDVPVI